MIFTKTINIDRLAIEIKSSSISKSIASIVSSGANCDIKFKGELSQDESETLSSIVNSHIAVPPEEEMPPVSARQIRTAMVYGGLSIEAIETALDGLPEPTKTVAKIAWDYASDFERDNPLVVSLAPVLGLSEQQLNDLWDLAKTL
jgi:hypothetical protein